MPSTTVTASYMTQGRVEYESTIPRGTDVVLDLWEAEKLDGVHARLGTATRKSLKQLAQVICVSKIFAQRTTKLLQL